MKSLLKLTDDISLEEYILHIDYKSKFVGEITARMQTGTKILWDGEMLKILYPDGTKWTINYSWFI